MCLILLLTQRTDAFGRDLVKLESDYQVKFTNPQRSINSPATGEMSPQVQELERHTDTVTNR